MTTSLILFVLNMSHKAAVFGLMVAGYGETEASREGETFIGTHLSKLGFLVI